MRNKKGLEFSFAWLFAIIAGAVIIFLAIYGTVKIIGSEREASQSEVGKKLGILLNPVETSIESAKISRMVFPVETRIYNGCEEYGPFGAQRISTSTKMGFGDEWADPGVPSTFYNKYLFSEDIIEGKEFVLFSKPFIMPFKIADMIFVWPADEKFCFVGAPAGIEDELEALNPGNINFTSSANNCEKGSVKVCFSISNCDIDVAMDLSGQSGSVTKNFDKVYFEGPLVYGAIFSSKEVYECQAKRIMKRASELSTLYASKAISSSGGCGSSSLVPDLIIYANKTLIKDSSELSGVAYSAEEIGRANENLLCKLF